MSGGNLPAAFDAPQAPVDGGADPPHGDAVEASSSFPAAAHHVDLASGPGPPRGAGAVGKGRDDLVVGRPRPVAGRIARAVQAPPPGFRARRRGAAVRCRPIPAGRPAAGAAAAARQLDEAGRGAPALAAPADAATTAAARASSPGPQITMHGPAVRAGDVRRDRAVARGRPAFGRPGGVGVDQDAAAGRVETPRRVRGGRRVRPDRKAPVAVGQPPERSGSPGCGRRRDVGGPGSALSVWSQRAQGSRRKGVLKPTTRRAPLSRAHQRRLAESLHVEGDVVRHCPELAAQRRPARRRPAAGPQHHAAVETRHQVQQGGVAFVRWPSRRRRPETRARGRRRPESRGRRRRAPRDGRSGCASARPALFRARAGDPAQQVARRVVLGIADDGGPPAVGAHPPRAPAPSRRYSRCPCSGRRAAAAPADRRPSPPRRSRRSRPSRARPESRPAPRRPAPAARRPFRAATERSALTATSRRSASAAAPRR